MNWCELYKLVRALGTRVESDGSPDAQLVYEREGVVGAVNDGGVTVDGNTYPSWIGLSIFHFSRT